MYFPTLLLADCQVKRTWLLVHASCLQAAGARLALCHSIFPTRALLSLY